MPENPHYDEAIVNPETHHETSDVSIRALIWFAVIFVVFAIVAHFALWMLFKAYARIERQRNTGEMTEMQRPADMAVPKNQPLLQPFPRKVGTTPLPPNRSTPVTELADMRSAEQRALTTYSWVDQQKGIVRMPIDVAMKITLQRGLPVQLSGAPAPSPANAAGGGGAPQRIPDTGAHP